MGPFIWSTKTRHACNTRLRRQQSPCSNLSIYGLSTLHPTSTIFYRAAKSQRWYPSEHWTSCSKPHNVKGEVSFYRQERNRGNDWYGCSANSSNPNWRESARQRSSKESANRSLSVLRKAFTEGFPPWSTCKKLLELAINKYKACPGFVESVLSTAV